MPTVAFTAVLILLPLLIRISFLLATARAIARLADVIGGRVSKSEATRLTRR